MSKQNKMSDALKRAQQRYRQKPEVKERDAARKQRDRQKPEVKERNRAYEITDERRAYKTQKAREYRAKQVPVIAYKDIQVRLKELRAIGQTSISLISPRAKLEEEIKRIDPDWWKNAITQLSIGSKSPEHS